MVKGIGIDIVDVKRFEVTRSDNNVQNQILTTNERNRAKKEAAPTAYTARIFAIKEAVVKALGCGFNKGLLWHDIEVSEGDDVRLSGYFQNIAREKDVKKIHSTHSYSLNHIVALVVLEGQTKESP